MMIDKRLIGMVPESKKYVAGNVLMQWISLAANVVLMMSITRFFASLYAKNVTGKDFAVFSVKVYDNSTDFLACGSAVSVFNLN